MATEKVEFVLKDLNWLKTISIRKENMRNLLVGVAKTCLSILIKVNLQKANIHLS